MMTTPQARELVMRDPMLKGVLTFDKRVVDAGWRGLRRMAARLQEMNFSRAYALQRSGRTAMLLALARIPFRVGFSQAGFSCLYHKRYHRVAGMHDVLRNLSIVDGPENATRFSDELRLFAPLKEEISSELLRRLGDGKDWVLVSPGSEWKTKRWFPEGYREVMRELRRRGSRVIVIGSPAEREVAQAAAAGLDVENLAGETTISEVLYLVKNAKLLVCNDSMCMHVASALKVPTVAVFCATSPEFGFGPWKNDARVVEKQGLPCKPCARHGGRRCPAGTEACMRELEARDVLAAVDELNLFG